MRLLLDVLHLPRCDAPYSLQLGFTWWRSENHHKGESRWNKGCEVCWKSLFCFPPAAFSSFVFFVRSSPSTHFTPKNFLNRSQHLTQQLLLWSLVSAPADERTSSLRCLERWQVDENCCSWQVRKLQSFSLQFHFPDWTGYVGFFVGFFPFFSFTSGNFNVDSTFSSKYLEINSYRNSYALTLSLLSCSGRTRNAQPV